MLLCCDCSGTGPPDVQPPGCLCLSPQTLYQWVANPALNFGMFQNATLQWGLTPPGLAALTLGTSCYLSTGEYVDAFTGDLFRYHVYCNTTLYVLTRVYESAAYAFPPGGPYRDVVRYAWSPTTSPNACSPFSLTAGGIYAGGDPSVVVHLTGTNVHGI